MTYRTTSRILPLPQRLEGRAVDAQAGIKLDYPNTQTYIKLTRIFPTDDLLADTNNAEIQTELTNLANDFQGLVKRRLMNLGDGLVYGSRDLKDPKACSWHTHKCNPHANYKLSVRDAHICYGYRFSPTFPTAPLLLGNEITWRQLHVAMQILRSHMTTDAYRYTECLFEIWDGNTKVGAAQITKVVDAYEECVF